MGLAQKDVVRAGAVQGIFASIALTAFYFLVMRLLSGSWDQGLTQYRQLEPYITILVVSLGLQVWSSYLAQHLVTTDGGLKAKSNTTRKSSLVSAASMVGCCLHHLSDITPLLGSLSATFLFLAAYQKSFLVVGIAINGWGIIRNLSQICSHPTSK
jgi:hypothetical protein